MCLDRARADQLIASLPGAVDEFTVDKMDDGVIAHRPGRKMTELEGQTLWRLFSSEYFPRGGLAGGSQALSATEKCPAVGDASCLHLEWWACETSLPTLLGWIREAASRSGAGDAELEIVLQALGSHGPSCKDGPQCKPAPHYSKRDAFYDPEGERHASPLGGAGDCKDDGDCQGAGSNICSAWYMRGGAEIALAIEVGGPTFCGCVEHRCTWFTQ